APRPAPHPGGASSIPAPPWAGRAGSSVDRGGAHALLPASSRDGRAVPRRSRAGRDPRDTASPQYLLLAVVEPEQRDDGLATRAGAARGASSRPVRYLVTIMDGRPLASGGSRPQGGKTATLPLHPDRRQFRCLPGS